MMMMTLMIVMMMMVMKADLYIRTKPITRCDRESLCICQNNGNKRPSQQPLDQLVLISELYCIVHSFEAKAYLISFVLLHRDFKQLCIRNSNSTERQIILKNLRFNKMLHGAQCTESRLQSKNCKLILLFRFSTGLRPFLSVTLNGPHLACH